MLRTLGIAALLALPPLTAVAEDMTVIVERGPKTVEVFVGLPADGLLDVFALPPKLLEDESGQVAFEPLRLGTWLIGDAVIAKTDTRVGGVPTVYEAMSLMVHPEDRKLPLYDAMDGLMAIAVCSVEPPENPTLETLYSYVGFIAYPEDPMAALSFTLPETGRDEISVEIRDFRKGQLMEDSVVLLADGGTLTLAPRSASFSHAAIGSWALFVVLGLVNGAVLLSQRRRTA